DIDNVNFTTFLRAVAFEVSKDPVIDDSKLPGIMEKIAKAMKKDPMAYRDLVISNTDEIKKQDETRKMREVKPGNMVDKDNGMEEVKGQEKYKADSAPKTEYRKGKPEGVKEMGITPKKAPGIKDVMDMPGKEKVLDQLKESLKKSLKEDTHFNYSPGMEVQTPKGTGIVRDIMGGTISVEFPTPDGQPGEVIDYQINVLDKAAQKAAFDKLPDLGTIGQNWLSSQVNEAKPKKDKYSKLREFLKKALKKEAVKFKAGGETIFTNNAEAAAKEAELKKAGVKYTKTSA
ncbi:MAG: hypothetical protein EBU90_31325, partial [Proteobacteria bacterium]|nr:hypothetical protein [Pseudomonadota bacterium]